MSQLCLVFRCRMRSLALWLKLMVESEWELSFLLESAFKCIGVNKVEKMCLLFLIVLANLPTHLKRFVSILSKIHVLVRNCF